MDCGLCKQPIFENQRTVGVTHYACEVQLTDSWRSDVERLTAQRDQLRAALAALVGVDGRTELEQLEATMRLLPMPAQDRAQTIDAIHALIATLPESGRE